MANEKEALFRKLFKPQNHTVPGIIAFVNTLKAQKIPMAVATSAPYKNADYILSELSIKSYFTAVLDSSHVKKGKPDPEVYLKAAKALRKQPANCIVIEDSLSGVKAGLDAGARVIGVKTTHTSTELDDCHMKIDDFTALTINDLRTL
jgi:HAD superfamily hydrolase (TIGR01509 family)